MRQIIGLARFLVRKAIPLFGKRAKDLPPIAVFCDIILPVKHTVSPEGFSFQAG
ncbi:MAG: hypothetical protein ACT4SY_02925 [Hyphomicrobiales bacterium]